MTTAAMIIGHLGVRILDNPTPRISGEVRLPDESYKDSEVATQPTDT